MLWGVVFFAAGAAVACTAVVLFSYVDVAIVSRGALEDFLAVFGIEWSHRKSRCQLQDLVDGRLWFLGIVLQDRSDEHEDHLVSAGEVHVHRVVPCADDEFRTARSLLGSKVSDGGEGHALQVSFHANPILDVREERIE